jgi:hypothetical protein
LPVPPGKTFTITIMTSHLPVHGLLVALLYNLFSMAGVYAQDIIFSDSLGSFDNNRFCMVAGSINNQYFIIENPPDSSPRYLALDTNCRLITKAPLSFIPTGGFITCTMTAGMDAWTILWQSLQGHTWYLHYTWLSAAGNKIIRSAVIDSALLAPAFIAQPYFVRGSANHQYQLLFRRIPIPEKDQVLAELLIVNTTEGKGTKGQLLLDFNAAFDLLGDVVIDDSGNVFTSVFYNPLNFRYSSNA